MKHASEGLDLALAALVLLEPSAVLAIAALAPRAWCAPSVPTLVALALVSALALSPLVVLGCVVRGRACKIPACFHSISRGPE